MANYSAKAIVNEFLHRRGGGTWPQQMYIQKLAYIAHGWNLAINNEPLIAEQPEAWDNGPVFRSVWDHIRDYGYRGRDYALVDPLTSEEFKADLKPDERAVIDHVWRKYGLKSADDLSGMTHEPDTPWYKAYLTRGRNALLSNAEIADHYVKLAMAGRENRS
jgi:uncharacterized phage-associated protein